MLGGYRLARPPKCPKLMYQLMAECWAEKPEERPTFAAIDQRFKQWRLDDQQRRNSQSWTQFGEEDAFLAYMASGQRPTTTTLGMTTASSLGSTLPSPSAGSQALLAQAASLQDPMSEPGTPGLAPPGAGPGPWPPSADLPPAGDPAVAPNLANAIPPAALEAMMALLGPAQPAALPPGVQPRGGGASGSSGGGSSRPSQAQYGAVPPRRTSTGVSSKSDSAADLSFSEDPIIDPCNSFSTCSTMAGTSIVLTAGALAGCAWLLQLERALWSALSPGACVLRAGLLHGALLARPRSRPGRAWPSPALITLITPAPAPAPPRRDQQAAAAAVQQERDAHLAEGSWSTGAAPPQAAIVASGRPDARRSADSGISYTADGFSYASNVPGDTGPLAGQLSLPGPRRSAAQAAAQGQGQLPPPGPPSRQGSSAGVTLGGDPIAPGSRGGSSRGLQAGAGVRTPQSSVEVPVVPAASAPAMQAASSSSDDYSDEDSDARQGQLHQHHQQQQHHHQQQGQLEAAVPAVPPDLAQLRSHSNSRRRPSALLPPTPEHAAAQHAAAPSLARSSTGSSPPYMAIHTAIFAQQSVANGGPSALELSQQQAAAAAALQRQLPGADSPLWAAQLPHGQYAYLGSAPPPGCAARPAPHAPRPPRARLLQAARRTHSLAPPRLPCAWPSLHLAHAARAARPPAAPARPRPAGTCRWPTCRSWPRSRRRSSASARRRA